MTAFKTLINVTDPATMVTHNGYQKIAFKYTQPNSDDPAKEWTGYVLKGIVDKNEELCQGLKSIKTGQQYALAKEKDEKSGYYNIVGVEPPENATKKTGTGGGYGNKKFVKRDDDSPGAKVGGIGHDAAALVAAGIAPTESNICLCGSTRHFECPIHDDTNRWGIPTKAANLPKGGDAYEDLPRPTSSGASSTLAPTVCPHGKINPKECPYCMLMPLPTTLSMPR